MRSLFIGLGLVFRILFAFVICPPLAVAWILGEQHQGRRKKFWDTDTGFILAMVAGIWTFFMLFVGAYAVNR
jgi:hypothetical protein